MRKKYGCPILEEVRCYSRSLIERVKIAMRLKDSPLGRDRVDEDVAKEA